MKSTLVEKNLQFVSQSDDFYTVKSDSGKVFTIKKIYSHANEQREYNFYEKWMAYAAFGLPLGGIPTVLIAPLVFWKNNDLLKHKNLTANERIYAKHLLVMSVLCFIISILFFALFIMHLLF